MKTLIASTILTAVSLPFTFAAQAPASMPAPAAPAKTVKTTKVKKTHTKSHKKTHVAAKTVAPAK